ncbi:MAG: copper chaperone PCu(A)C [Gammaproteobacteria bacterium]
MKRILLLSLAMFATVAQAGSPLLLRDAWIRAMPPTAKTSAAYLVIENQGEQEDALVGAQVDGAEVTELHEMAHEGHAMTMRQRSEIVVPAGGVVELKPGGLHLMLIGLQRPLVMGETRKALLQFRQAGEISVELDVRSR